MKNSVVKLLDGEKVGFLLGMMAYANFEDNAGVTIEQFFGNAKKGEVSKKNLGIFFKSVADCYNYSVTKEESDVDLNKVYFWLDEIMQNGELEEILSKLLESPKVEKQGKKVAEAGKH